MGRSPCCDKVGLKKGPWTPEEDQKLLAYIEEHGHGSWRALPTKAGLERCGKSCRLRWTNYLRPDIKRGKFSLQEDQTIIQLHALLGNRWSAIATHMPKRTDNEIKNYWNTHLKKRLTKMGIDPVTHKPKSDTLLSNQAQPKTAANLSHMAQWESARLEAEARLVRQSKIRSSTFQNPLNQQVVPAAKPRCVDVLNTLDGFWVKGVDGGDGGGGREVSVMGISGDLESSTSTLSYSDNAQTGVNPGIPQGSNVTSIGESSDAFIELLRSSSGSCEAGILKEEAEKDWKKFENSNYLPEYNSMSYTSGLNDMTLSTIENSWTEESLRAEDVPSGNFVETFTELLLSGSGDPGDRNISEDDGDTDNGGSRSGNGTNSSNYSEDDKTYWNSILQLVNSSPSDSPVL